MRRRVRKERLMARAEMVAGVRRGEGEIATGDGVGGGRLVEEGEGGGVGEEEEVEAVVEVKVEDAEDDEVVEELEDDDAEEGGLGAV